jgi:hypothetical protein
MEILDEKRKIFRMRVREWLERQKVGKYCIKGVKAMAIRFFTGSQMN